MAFLSVRDPLEKDMSAFLGMVPASPGEKKINPPPQTLPHLPTNESLPKTLCGYDLVRLAGGGAYSDVYVVSDKGEQKALKIPHGNYEQQGVDSPLEISILTTFRHPHLLHAEQLIVHPDCKDIAMLLPLANASLIELIQSKPPFNMRLTVAYKVFCAVGFLLRQNILYMDLKPGNVRITADGEPLLTDFNMALHVDNIRLPTISKRYLVTSISRPIENLEGAETYSEASVIWQLGILLIFIMCGKIPNHVGAPSFAYTYPVDSDLDEKNVISWLRFNLMNCRIKLRDFYKDLPKTSFDHCIDLTTQLLDFDPVKRPPFDKVLAHPLFAGLTYIDGKVTPASDRKSLPSYHTQAGISIERLFAQMESIPVCLIAAKYVSSNILFLAGDLLYRTLHLVEHANSKERLVHNLTCHFIAWKYHGMQLERSLLLPQDLVPQLSTKGSFFENNPYATGISSKDIREMEIRLILHLKGRLYRPYLFDACTTANDVFRAVECLYSPDKVIEKSTDGVTQKPHLCELLANRIVPL